MIERRTLWPKMEKRADPQTDGVNAEGRHELLDLDLRNVPDFLKVQLDMPSLQFSSGGANPANPGRMSTKRCDASRLEWPRARKRRSTVQGGRARGGVVVH